MSRKIKYFDSVFSHFLASNHYQTMATASIFYIFNQVCFACKICNQVFTTFQLFTAHFESHSAQENLAVRRLIHAHFQRPLQPNFQETPQQPCLMSQPRTSQFLQNVDSQSPMPSFDNNVINMTSFFAPPIPRGNDDMDVSSVDGTKAYINQLNKPIDSNVFVNSANVNDNTLNLELGLYVNDDALNLELGL